MLCIKLNIIPNNTETHRISRRLTYSGIKRKRFTVDKKVNMLLGTYLNLFINPWYSVREGTEVYHNNSECTEVNNIEAYNVREGTGGKRLCKHCERLNIKQPYFPKFGLAEGVANIFASKVNGLARVRNIGGQ